MALFYLHRRHGWILQPPYIRGPHSMCFLLISGHSSNKKTEASELMAFFTYIVDTAGLHQPPYIRNPHLGASCSYPDIRQIKNQRQASLWRFFTYIVDTAGLHQPPYIRNPHLRATCSYPDIRQIKNQRQASLPLIFYFPHCLRLHHAHSGAGSCWHCWSVLFDCSYC